MFVWGHPLAPYRGARTQAKSPIHKVKGALETNCVALCKVPLLCGRLQSVWVSLAVLIAPMSQKKKKKNETQKTHKDLPGNLEAATFPKEQSSLPHDAFVSAEVHIFI